MFHKLFSFFILLSILATNAYSLPRKGVTINGKVVNSTTKAGIPAMEVTLLGTKSATTTEENGNFTLKQAPAGTHIIIISGIGIINDTISVNVGNNNINLGDIYPKLKLMSDDNSEIPTITICDNGVSQDDDVDVTSGQNSAGIYSGSIDQFVFMSGFIFGKYNFSPRGVDNMELQVNGVELEDLERGFNGYSQLGGLNDVLRNRNTTYGLAPSSFAYGSSNGVNYIEATAADQRKGTNVSYFNSNGNFRNRIMITHNSGVMKNGWAYSVSASHRWAQEGYVAGTFYDAYSLYGAISKVVKKSQFNLTTFASPTKRGQATFASMDEVYQLAADNQYNSSWGWQNGKKRNSKVVNSNQPLIIANHTYRPSDRTRWNSSFGYQFGKYQNSIIDFYNAYNPNPDYYRNLPSYYLNQNPAMPDVANAVRAQLLSNLDQLQMDWDGFYNANNTNYETIKNANGIAGNDVTGRRALYVNSNKVDDVRKFSINTNIEHQYNENLNLFGGARFVSQTDRYYKELFDLLGGDFYLNFNQFASQTAQLDPSFAQNDLNKPNQLVKTGDKYGYDYSMNIKQSDAWAQAAVTSAAFDYFLAASGGLTSYVREGFMKNGLFANNSFGKSEVHNFTTYKGKAGVKWKLDAQNNFYANADYTTEAPKVANTYVNPQKRDLVLNNPVVQKSKTLEIGYLHKSKRLYARVTGYVTDINDAVINKYFFNDDASTLAFINYVMQGVNMRSIGTEFSSSLKLNDEWSLDGIAALGQVFYTNRPSVSFYQDNVPSNTAVERKVYIKNYYVSTGPQTIASLAVNYRSRNYWNGRVNFNFMDNNYVDINPDRRTTEAADLVQPGSTLWNSIYGQEKLPAAFTVDISGGKSFNLEKTLKAHKKILLVLNGGVVNVLNKTNIKVRGYEQLRFDYTNRNPNKFLDKYDYAFGINYYVSLNLKF